MLSAKIFLYRVKGFLRDDVLFPALVFLRSDAFRSDFHQYFRNKFMPAKISLYFLCAAVIPALGYSGSVSASCFLNVRIPPTLPLALNRISFVLPLLFSFYLYGKGVLPHGDFPKTEAIHRLVGIPH